jgi:membrane-associated protease RseP (regulator of RpoE activity)
MHNDDVRKQVSGLHSTFDAPAMAQSDRAAAPPRKKPPITVNVVLFICTVATTILAGALQQGVNPLQDPTQMLKGLPFSAALLFILLAHEMGHFLTSKYYHIDASLPYFIPAPTLIGTFGAFIKMRSPVMNKRVLLDVGANGPLAGLLVTIPILAIGLQLSEVRALDAAGGEGMTLGTSIILSAMTSLILGNLPDTHQVILHPLGFAGWIGLLVTSMNLIPVGQLDGGHIAYAVFGRRTRHISRAVLLGMLVLGIWASSMWLMWALILFLLLGVRHPAPLDYDMPLDRRRRILGLCMLAVFVLTFVPVPFGDL